MNPSVTPENYTRLTDVTQAGQLPPQNWTLDLISGISLAPKRPNYFRKS